MRIKKRETCSSTPNELTRGTHPVILPIPREGSSIVASAGAAETHAPWESPNLAREREPKQVPKGKPGGPHRAPPVPMRKPHYRKQHAVENRRPNLTHARLPNAETAAAAAAGRGPKKAHTQPPHCAPPPLSENGSKRTVRCFFQPKRLRAEKAKSCGSPSAALSLPRSVKGIFAWGQSALLSPPTVATLCEISSRDGTGCAHCSASPEQRKQCMQCKMPLFQL